MFSWLVFLRSDVDGSEDKVVIRDSPNELLGFVPTVRSSSYEGREENDEFVSSDPIGAKTWGKPLAVMENLRRTCDTCVIRHPKRK